MPKVPAPGDPDFDWSHYADWKQNNDPVASAQAVLDRTTQDFGPVRPSIQAQYPMPQKSPLADRVRQTYPGHYDDMHDADLEKAILAKYPEYADMAVYRDQSVTGDHYKGPDTYAGGVMAQLGRTAKDVAPWGGALVGALAAPLTGGMSIPAMMAMEGGLAGGSTLAGHGISAATGNDESLSGTLEDAGENALIAGGGAGIIGGLAKFGRPMLGGAERGLGAAADTLRDVPGAGPKMRGTAWVLDKLGSLFGKFAPKSPMEPFAPNVSGYKAGAGFGEAAEPISYSPPERYAPNTSGYRAGQPAGEAADPIHVPPSPVERYAPNTTGYTPGASVGEAAEPIPGSVIDRYAPNTSTYTPPEPDPIAALKKILGVADDPEMSVVHDTSPVQGEPVSDEVEALVRDLVKPRAQAAPASVPVEASPSSPSVTDPSRMLPGFGESSETWKPGQSKMIGKLLRPDQRLIDLVNEYADRNGLGKVTNLKKYPMPPGDDELAKAIRQRGRQSKAANAKLGYIAPALAGLMASHAAQK